MSEQKQQWMRHVGDDLARQKLAIGNWRFYGPSSSGAWEWQNGDETMYITPYWEGCDGLDYLDGDADTDGEVGTVVPFPFMPNTAIMQERYLAAARVILHMAK